VDDVQEVNESALLALKSTVNFGFDSENRLAFILCGQPELKATLKYSRFLAVKQRIRLFFHMQGLSLQETCEQVENTYFVWLFRVQHRMVCQSQARSFFSSHGLQ